MEDIQERVENSLPVLAEALSCSEAELAGYWRELQGDEEFLRAINDSIRDVLDKDHLHWLGSLPAEMRIQTNGHDLWMRHASPWDEETYLYGDATEALARLHLLPGQILAVGHTHYPLHLRMGAGWLLNPGSVGQPRDRDPRASYAVLDLETEAVRHYRVVYDVQSVQSRLADRGWTSEMIAILSRTR